MNGFSSWKPSPSKKEQFKPASAAEHRLEGKTPAGPMRFFAPGGVPHQDRLTRPKGNEIQSSRRVVLVWRATPDRLDDHDDLSGVLVPAGPKPRPGGAEADFKLVEA